MFRLAHWMNLWKWSKSRRKVVKVARTELMMAVETSRKSKCAWPTSRMGWPSERWFWHRSIQLISPRSLILFSIHEQFLLLPQGKLDVAVYLYILCHFRKSSYTSLQRANSHDRIPTLLGSSERLLLASPEKPSPAVTPIVPSYRDRALSTIHQLRGHYQLSSDEIRLLAKNPDLKLITIRADIALQEAQRNLRNLKVSDSSKSNTMITFRSSLATTSFLTYPSSVTNSQLLSWNLIALSRLFTPCLSMLSAHLSRSFANVISVGCLYILDVLYWCKSWNKVHWIANLYI